MKNKILLVAPETVSDFKRAMQTDGKKRRRALVAPLHLATIAALTPKEFEVDIWDETLRGEIGEDIPLYEFTGVQTTRGCPFDCGFCDVIHLFGRRPRHKPVERVIEEVAALERLGVSRNFLVRWGADFKAFEDYHHSYLQELCSMHLERWKSAAPGRTESLPADRSELAGERTQSLEFARGLAVAVERRLRGEAGRGPA